MDISQLENEAKGWVDNEAKSKMENLISQKTPEAKQELVKLAQEHHIPVDANMNFDEIENKVRDVVEHG